MYAEVILPIAPDGTFTYKVPDSMAQTVMRGCRVRVPLGRSKEYVGMVLELHDRKPSFRCRDILEQMDAQPVVTSEQLSLWQWIADYYMCSLGDVLVAALPAGLKSAGGFKPRMEEYVLLDPRFQQPEAMNVLRGMLRRAYSQQKALDTYLALAKEGNGVTVDELINESHVTTAVVKALVSRGVFTRYKHEVGRVNDGPAEPTTKPKTLSDAQQEALDSVLKQFEQKNVVLLHGVTSSGKTEIYIHLIQRAIDEGRQVLFLLPEIALTVQITSRLKRVFGDRLGIYHSKYSDNERVEIWMRQLSDHPYDVILGARSAVMLPFRRLGLVIVDEEHENSFKQQDPAPRYHARSVAIVLAQMMGAKTVLGTATPCMESIHNCATGKYGYARLSERYKGVELPEIEVVDIKDLRRRKMMSGPFSPRLMSAVREALDHGKQAILFQNRRGFAPTLVCRTCGWTPRCQYCDVSLTYHKVTQRLVCHYCGSTYDVPRVCPACGDPHLLDRGYGTEKIEDLVREVFPQAKVARMDLDTTRSKKAYERIINDFSEGKTNVLIGTQMVSKGLDFGNVSVVGILDADNMLNYPDFRAYEHAFMMMSQVSGRAGRRGKRGLVILQTRQPDLPVIRQVVNHDLKGFYEDLKEERQMFHYPPYYHLVYVYLRHHHSDVVEMAANEMGNRLRSYFGNRVLGPDKPSVAVVKTQAIRKIIIKMENGLDLKAAKAYMKEAQRLLLQDKRYASLTVYYDVDPL